MNPLVTHKVKLANHFSEKGRTYKAESLYKQALICAVKEAGENSAVQAFVQNELMYFYETHGRHDEANALWEQIRATVLLKLASGRIRIVACDDPPADGSIV